MKITGAMYYRVKKNMTRKELAELSGLDFHTISRVENGGDLRKMLHKTVANYAQALGVTMDALMEVHDISELGNSTHIVRSRTAHPGNCIANFAREKHYTMKQLGDVLGVTGEREREYAPPRYVQILAEREGVLPAEFRRRYGNDDQRGAA